MSGQPVRFPNESGEPLVGRLESPAHCKPRAYALYAHCFTCGKDVRAAVDISRALCKQGIAVLRFDFTGLGESAGSFADTTFSTNISDLLAAVRFLEQTHEAPKILIGHSLGGTAILEAAHRVPSCIAIITIAAPASPEHVVRLLGSARDAIEDRGVSAVMLAGRKFQFKKAFLDDLKTQHWEDNIRALRKPLLIFHSPTDMTVDITNAAEIFAAARHPKSFVALTGADHLLSRPEDSEYVGLMIAAWATKYLGELGMVATSNLATEGEIVVQMGGEHYRADVYAGLHQLVADEPQNAGGGDQGPSPYDLLMGALGACTAITLRMYADRKRWRLQSMVVHLTHSKVHADDCGACAMQDTRIDKFVRQIELCGELSADQRQRLLEIANKCPVHQTLRSAVIIETSLKT